jgi:hypothetical protein
MLSNLERNIFELISMYLLPKKSAYYYYDIYVRGFFEILKNPEKRYFIHKSGSSIQRNFTEIYPCLRKDSNEVCGPACFKQVKRDLKSKVVVS